MGILGRRDKRSWRGLRACLREDEGMVAVEFALVGGFVLYILFACIELGLVQTARQSLEHATFVASRLGRTGYADTPMTQEQTIIAELKKTAGLFLDPAKVRISKKAYSDLDGNDDKSVVWATVGKPEPFDDTNKNGKWDAGEPFTDVNGDGQHSQDRGTNSYGGQGSVVIYTVEYDWRPFMPGLGTALDALDKRPGKSNDGVVTLTAYSIVKNEPY